MNIYRGMWISGSHSDLPQSYISHSQRQWTRCKPTSVASAASPSCTPQHWRSTCEYIQESDLTVATFAGRDLPEKTAAKYTRSSTGTCLICLESR
ncbi:hypothetical protein DPMN_070767 [Dreissena polymorpha]|uniref:Uncharacterized protein n=1 Tax=Dreissena polymorpha TaxID=45954 RepID=A0A9D3Z622_DREPO|nr:hypothetical protein DPMN_070767 [Dreissena polymorpha]